MTARQLPEWVQANIDLLEASRVTCERVIADGTIDARIRASYREKLVEVERQIAELRTVHASSSSPSSSGTGCGGG
jgi:hypothetical protein